MNPSPVDIRSVSLQLVQEWMEKHDETRYRSGQLWRALHQRGASSWQELTELPLALRNTLAQDFAFHAITVVEKSNASDGSTKLCLAFYDGRNAECVFLPHEDHSTVCLSTQTGCRMGCVFCRTAQLGKGRNLESFEIEAQFHKLAKTTSKKPRNVVFMGMGEPLDNFDNTVGAARLLADPDGADVGFRRITVSTVGIAQTICKLAEVEPRLKLALSLVSPFQEQRERLTPIARRYTLPMLMEALRYHFHCTHRRSTIEYLLLAGINDTHEHAQGLLELFSATPCKINLIAYNTNPELPFISPDLEMILLFQSWLREGPNAVMIRTSKGKEIAAACGQLAGGKSEADQKPSGGGA